MNKILSNRVLRLLTEVLFLLIFGFLILQGRAQAWVIIFAFGILLSLFLSRLFCGWICPMATVMRVIDWLYSKVPLKSPRAPNLVKKDGLRWLVLVLFLGTMIFSQRMGVKINLILYLFMASLIISLFFGEEFWHRYLCPFGSILSLTGGRAFKSLKIDQDKCTGCGLCQRVCPGEAIETIDDEKRSIIKKECLTCLNCQQICPVEAIEWR